MHIFLAAKLGDPVEAREVYLEMKPEDARGAKFDAYLKKVSENDVAVTAAADYLNAWVLDNSYLKAFASDIVQT